MIFFILGILILAVLVIWDSFLSLLKRTNIKSIDVVVYKLILLVLIYLTITITFAVLYLLFIVMGFPVLDLDEDSVAQLLQSVVYFSAVTLLSVGYGDITPIGIGRWIAVIEAMIGYLLPATFFISTVYDQQKIWLGRRKMKGL